MPAKKTPRSSRRKPTGALAALAESKKRGHVLLGDIQQHAVKKAQADDSRRQDIIHPSEMAKQDWCPRATTYRIRGIRPSNPAKANGHQLETIFQEGHDIHSKWQTWLAEMGRLWGKWVCTCGHEEWGTNSECPCGYPMKYDEVPLDAEEQWMIVGHADGAVPDIRSFIEVKSIGVGTLRMEEPELVRANTVKAEGSGKSVVDLDGLWKGIKRPLKSHRKQAGIYLAIANLLGWDYDQMIFIYENKGNQATKEFVVRYSEDMVADLIDTAKDIKWAVEHDRDLPRPQGFEKTKKPCKECPFRDWCWAGEEDEQEDGQQEQDPAVGSRVAGGEEETRPAADLHAEPTGRVPRSARRSNRPQRQRADEPDDTVHEVGRVPRSTTGGGRGRRVVRRRVSEPRQGD